jgi:hypothetical protein
MPQSLLMAQVLNDFNSMILCCASVQDSLFETGGTIFTLNDKKMTIMDKRIAWTIVCLQSSLETPHGAGGVGCWARVQKSACKDYNKMNKMKII